jgi:hypothetical protein
MRLNGTSLEQKAQWLREKCNTPSPADYPLGAFVERHFTVAEVAELWNLSPDAVRRLFENEPGVLVLGDRGAGKTRRYRTLRIPQGVVECVHRRMTKA